MASKSKKRKQDDDEGETDEQARRRRCGEVEDDEDDVKRQYSINPVIQKFFEDHGDFVKDRSTVLFKDGARIQVSASGYGFQQEPPEDEHELAKLRLQFFKKKCVTAESKFRDYKELLMGIGEGVTYESTENAQKAKLVKLKARAVKARERLRKAQKVVDDTTPAWMNLRRKIDAEEKQKKSALKNWAANIKL